MKAKAINWKYLKFLFWLGPVLVIMGATAGLVSGSWSALPIGLLIAGIGVIVLWLLLDSSPKGGFFGRRSTQVGTNAVIATLSAIAILGLINVLAVRYPVRLDLTENQIFTLAPQSVETVQALAQPVKVWIFAETPNPQDQQLLQNYRQQGSQFSYEYVNPQAQPGLAQRFNVQTLGEVYLEIGDTRQFVQTLTPEERLSERRLTNALAQVSSDRTAKVYFLQGHGERPLEGGQRGLTQAVAQLEEEGFTAEPLNLAASPQIPADADVVVVAGPQRELLEPEVNALGEYLERKSGLMLLIDPQTDPGLDSILEPWGIQFGDRLIVDPAGQAAGLGVGVTIINQYGQHPITEDFGNGISLYPVARPIGIEPKSSVSADSLLITSDRTQAQRIAEDGQLQFDPSVDPEGSFTLAAAFTRNVDEPEAASSPSPSPSLSPNATASPSPNAAASPSPSPTATASPSPSPTATASPSPSPDTTADADALDEEPANDSEASQPEARLVAIGNSAFITDGLFDQQLNGDVFLNAISWLSQQDDQLLSIRPAEMTSRRIVMSGQQRTLVTLGSLAILPLLALVVAIAVWWKRR
ncbi:Gldg family protein [Oculatella sp. LEGE 06141]|uniref:Gldg family protein n=1 Tax=Oculatella sp. LEGE 06141 TaxID=1828648 RepID=UPI0018803FF3|nr:Gldg family protein [Oculatella sp. LEGE 06141]MBE9177417.1 Gldg family protein [Oculatella sp. LEGE 06141]